jgi:hypothetical protein
MALWIPISATLRMGAVLTLLHAFMFLGLRYFSLFFFLLGGLHCFLLWEVIYISVRVQVPSIYFLKLFIL